MKQPEAQQLFIGNVPRDWSESELRTLMEAYGEIHSLNILKDKMTGGHKGCAFISFYEKDAATAAQEELHEKKTLPGSRNPIIVKPADSETKVENRNLFLGMLSRSCDDNQLRDMFSPFGTIESLTILKTSDGKSKGCGFIKFASRQSAQNAIKAMHNSLTMEGCPKSIVVKLADSDKEKVDKKRQYEGGNTYSSPNNHYNSSNPRSSNVRGGDAYGASNTYGSLNMRGPSSYDSVQNAVGQLGAGVGAASHLGGAFAPQQQTAISQQLLAQMALPQIVAAHPNLLAAYPNLLAGAMNPLAAVTNQFASSTNPLASTTTNPLAVNANLLAAPASQGTTMAALLALAQQQQLLQQQQTQQLQQSGGNQTDSYGNGYGNSQQAAAQMTIGGTLGANLSTLQSHLSGTQASGLANVSALGGVGALSAYANAGAGTRLGNASAGAANGSGGLGGNLYQQPYSGVQQYTSNYPPHNSGGFRQQQQGGQGPIRESNIRGPEGANLFIYHIPTEFNDDDLKRTFAPYGNVLSAKVFLDKQTGLSKSYGFVNYENAESAQASIQALNGFQIGSKRLKVELKKPREHGSKPY